MVPCQQHRHLGSISKTWAKGCCRQNLWWCSEEKAQRSCWYTTACTRRCRQAAQCYLGQATLLELCVSVQKDCRQVHQLRCAAKGMIAVKACLNA